MDQCGGPRHRDRPPSRRHHGGPSKRDPDSGPGLPQNSVHRTGSRSAPVTAGPLASGAWDEEFGHLRDQPTYEGSLVIVRSTP